MITQNSHISEIIAESKLEAPKVLYYLRKSFGSRLRYEDYTRKSEEECKSDPLHRPVISRVVDYCNPASGNKWKVFQVTRCTEDGYPYSIPYMFLYWNTIGSVGAIICVQNDVFSDSAIVFSSHFFQRLAERNGIKEADEALVCAFLIRNYSFSMSMTIDEDNRQCVDIVCNDGLCRGWMVESSDRMAKIEIKTYLSDRMLTPKQAAESSMARKMHGDVSDIEPQSVIIQRFIDAKTNKERNDIAMDHVVKKCMAAGISKTNAERYYNVMTHCMTLMLIYYQHDRSELKAFREMEGVSDAISKHVSMYISQYPDISNDPPFVIPYICSTLADVDVGKVVWSWMKLCGTEDRYLKELDTFLSNGGVITQEDILDEKNKEKLELLNNKKHEDRSRLRTPKRRVSSRRGV